MLPNDDGDTLLHQRIARTFLVEARKSTEAAKHGRLRAIQLARKYGLTNREIGDLLGISESGVRNILARAED